MREIRFGVIGCGLMGKEFASAAARWMHLTNLNVKPVIVAVCDQSPEASDWFRRQVPTVDFATAAYRELIARQDVEAIYCAVPHNLHAEIYVEIILAGKHLLAEKPFGIDLQAAETIAAAIRSRPGILVRCASEFPFFPGAQRITDMIERKSFGTILEVRSSFLHSSDLDPAKPINWKRRIATNGEYGCMGDLGLHVCHVPFRAGWAPKNVRALLTKVFAERPDGIGGMAPCETWDNAVLACESVQGFPMIFETKRVSPGDTNTWSICVYGTENSAVFSTKYSKTLRTMPYTRGASQSWREEDLGYSSAYKTITGGIFEFGFTDAIQQMWAAFLDELANGNHMVGTYRCATPEEALASHYLFTAALQSQRDRSTVSVPISPILGGTS